MVAAACSEAKDGERGDGGLFLNTSALVIDILLGRDDWGELDADGGSELRSGGMFV